MIDNQVINSHVVISLFIRMLITLLGKKWVLSNDFLFICICRARVDQLGINLC